MGADTTARLRPVDSLPVDRPAARRRGAQNEYLPLLLEVKERVRAGEGVGDDGELLWWPIREYKDPRGANKAFWRIEQKAVEIPPGRWEWETRRVGTGSVLFVRYLPRGHKSASALKGGDSQ